MAGRADGTTGLAVFILLLVFGGLAVAGLMIQGLQLDGWRSRGVVAAATQPAAEPARPSEVAPSEDVALAQAPAAATVPEIQVGGWARVANTDKQGVVLRNAPRKDARVPQGFLEGARVHVLERSGEEWVHVRGENGLQGWVPAQYLAPES